MSKPLPDDDKPDTVPMTPELQLEWPLAQLQIPTCSRGLFETWQRLLTAYDKGLAEGRSLARMTQRSDPLFLEILSRRDLNRRTYEAALKHGDLITAACATGRAEAYEKAYQEHMGRGR